MIQPLKMVSGRGVGARIGREDNWSKRETWPADDPEYIFMGVAIDRVGQALFGDKWRGDEPQGSPNWPAPLPPMSEASDSIRADVAMATPRTRQHFRKGEIVSYTKGEPVPELTEQEWAQADDARTAKRAASAESHARWQAVIEAMDWPLRRQEMDTYARKAKSTYFAKADPKAWSIDDIEQRFRTLRMNAGAPNDDYSNDRGWIFFGRESFDSFIRRLRGVPKPMASQPHTFDRDAEHFSLYDAVLWTATGGADTTTGDIYEQDLVEAGAQVLFPLLSHNSAPDVTGYNDSRLREAVPHEYWELAQVWEATDGHQVVFYDSGKGVVADLIPYRHTKPKWTSLRLASADLFALIPKPKKAEAKNDIAEQRAFKEWFEAKVKASPYTRTVTYKADIRPWLDKNAPTLSLRMYRDIRKIVLEDAPPGHGWGKEG
jgi:hypothetical protein